MGTQEEKDEKFLGHLAWISGILLCILAYFLHNQFVNKGYCAGISGCAAAAAFLVYTRTHKKYFVGFLIGMATANGMALANSVLLHDSTETCEIVGIFGAVQHAPKRSLGPGIERIRVSCGESGSEVYSFLAEVEAPTFGAKVTVKRSLLGYKKI